VSTPSRLYKEHCNVTCRLNAFVCRNVNVWNRLPAHVVNSDSVTVFKQRLACVNLVNFCSMGHLLVLFKRQHLCPACFYFYVNQWWWWLWLWRWTKQDSSSRVLNTDTLQRKRSPRTNPSVNSPAQGGFKCVEALGRIIIRGPYPPSNAIIYMHLQL